MIVKELDPLTANASPQAKAGRRAEEQMAFYLRRAFAEDPAVIVLNGLRVERQGEVAQIDHLLITNHGFILVESKSVTTKIRVNEQGEWSRQVGHGWQGMPSPLLQVERQADILRALLNDHVDRFFRKLLTIQLTFRSVPFDGLVAISDSGLIQRPKGFATERVLKADQIVGRVQDLNEEYRRASSLFSLSLKNPGAEWSAKTVNTLTTFLLEQHNPPPAGPFTSARPSIPGGAESGPRSRVVAPMPKPAIASAPQPNPSSPTATAVAGAATAHHCRACGSQRLAILYGKFGYYFKCADCDGNTPIKVACANGGKAKISKRGREFYVVCADNSEPKLFYVNPIELDR